MSKVLTQAEAVALFLPQIEATGVDCAKYAEIETRPAVVGEVVVTITGDGKETHNTAKEGDLVLCNVMTAAKELYLLNAEKVAKRYKPLGPATVNEGWQRWLPTGECRALRYTGEDTSFVAPWGEEMVLKNNDEICTPLPDKGQVYRIARVEFDSTYRPKN